MTSSSLGSPLVPIVPLASVGSTQAASEPDVSEPEVPRFCRHTGDRSRGIRFIEEHVVGLDNSDSDDFLGDLREEHEGVSNLGLREDLGSLLKYFHAR